MEYRVYLVLEVRQISEEDQEEKQHARIEAEEEAHLIEKARLKSEEKDLRLKAENEARLVEEARLKAD